MASKREFAEFISEQLREAGIIRYKSMFGEYGVFCDNKFFAMICDDMFFVKITPETLKEFPHIPKKSPYEGAKEYFYIENVEDREFMCRLAIMTCENLLEPRKRRK